ncbi:MAG: lipoate--protein ligase family protein [Thainema sp.]
MANIWRLIPLIDAPGAVQMAIDAWLLEQHLAGKMPSVLRFYTWSPAAISLGYHQRSWPEHWQHLTWQGQLIDLVRRPTGGRAVLHQGDLTYAVITSNLLGSRMEVYRYLCQFLITGLRSHNLSLQFGEAGRGYIHNPDCFGTATAADLVLPTGEKLIGSAQLRRRQGILQHGSIRVQQDVGLLEEVFSMMSEGERAVEDGKGFDEEDRRVPLSEAQRTELMVRREARGERLEESSLSSGQCLGVERFGVSISELIESLATAAQAEFGIELREEPLTAAEYAAATDLLKIN